MATVAWERSPATREEYEALPDSVRAEYVDDHIVMAPSHTRGHQNAVDRLRNVLAGSLPSGYDVTREWAWRPAGSANEYNPDLMVHPATDEETRFTGTPVLCVEVVSPGSRGHDYVTKAAKYAEAGCDHYWIVDPDEATLNVLIRRGEHFEVSEVVGIAAPTEIGFGVAAVTINLAAVLA